MRAILFSVLVFVASLSAAMADEASDYLAAAGEQANAYGACTAEYAKLFVKSERSAEAIADAAAKACRPMLGDVVNALMGAPTNLDAAKASVSAAQLEAKSHDNLVDLIKKARE